MDEPLLFVVSLLALGICGAAAVVGVTYVIPRAVRQRRYANPSEVTETAFSSYQLFLSIVATIAAALFATVALAVLLLADDTTLRSYATPLGLLGVAVCIASIIGGVPIADVYIRRAGRGQRSTRTKELDGVDN